MSEIPDVVPGEPVESSWGNLIRDRVVQRYADATARDNLVPVPEDGAVSWLDDPGRLEVYDEDAGVWVWPLANNEGDLLSLVGAPPSMRVERTDLSPDYWEMLPGSDLSLTFRRWDDAAGAFTNGIGLLPTQQGNPVTGYPGTNGAFRVAGPLLLAERPAVDRPWTSAMLELGNIGSVGTQGAFAVELVANYLRTVSGYAGLGANGQSGAGRVSLFPDGRIEFGAKASFGNAAFASSFTITEAATEPKNPIRMSGNTGNRLHYLTGSGGTLTPDFEAVWDAVSGSPFPTDQQLYRGAAAALRTSDVAAVTADADVAIVEAVTARAATPSIDDLTPMVVETTAGKAGAVVEVPDTWELGGTQRGLVALLVAEVQELRARVAALEGP